MDRGFGFIDRTFNDTGKNIWFHITTIKHDYPDLAKKLDSGLYKDVCCWYQINSTEREKVSKIWLDANEIPNKVKDDLIVYIEQQWSNEEGIPLWLESITIDLLGESRKNELNQIHTDKFQELRDARQKRREARRRKIRFESIEPKHVYVGLPKHLIEAVLWVARKYRTNPLSHIPGGSDVVVEYHDGRVFGYDWIKMPSAYIRKFFHGIIEYASDDFENLDEKSQLRITKNKISRFFARKYKDENDYDNAAFVEVWNSETSNEMPWDALRRFESKKQERNSFNKYDFIDNDSADYFVPQSAFEYYGYEPSYEDPTEKAERLWGIPDPRLVED